MWKVEMKNNKKLFALKEMSKAKIIERKNIKSVMSERRTLAKLKDSYTLILTLRFIINMLYAFQDRYNLYLVMDLLTGGDLRYHMNIKQKFTEAETSNIYA